MPKSQKGVFLLPKGNKRTTSRKWGVVRLMAHAVTFAVVTKEVDCLEEVSIGLLSGLS